MVQQTLNPPVVSAFADLFTLDPEITFLNHGSFGATPIAIQQDQQRWRDRMERQPVLFLGRDLNDLLCVARDCVAAYVGADGEDVIFVANSTSGVNVVAKSLEKTLMPGDEILGNDHEYGACVNAWEAVCKRSGARYVAQPLPLPDEIVGGDEAYVELLWRGVTPRTKVIMVSHITSPTALKLPIETIARRARAAGILTLVDGAHAPGQLPLDMQAIDADFYTGNFHKWLCAPKGSAFLYVRPALQHLIDPLVVSWGSLPHKNITTGNAFQDAMIFSGTADYTPYLSVPASIDFQAAHDWASVRTRASALLDAWLPRLAANFDLAPIYAGANAALRPPQLAITPLPAGVDNVALKQALYDEWRIEIPLTSHGDRNFARISLQAYNSEGDLERLEAALMALAQ